MKEWKMAADIALYVLEDPLHAALLLESYEGSGFDYHHHRSNVEFRFRSDSPSRQISLGSAAKRDALTNPLINSMRERAAATLENIPADRLVRGTAIPVSRLPGNKLKAMALADRALLRPGESTVDDEILVRRYFGVAFVIEAEAYSFLLAHGEQNGVDMEALKSVLDKGFGRIATVIAE